MDSLFRRFDPTGLIGLSLNWGSGVLVLIIIPSRFWALKSTPATLVSKTLIIVRKEFKATLQNFTQPGFLLISLRLFLFILITNFIGLFPFLFTNSRHLRFTLTLAFPLWVGHIIFSWIKTTQNNLAHLVPLGTPSGLLPFIVVVEIVRNCIRPATLAIRLAANIIAGHLLLALLGGQIGLNIRISLIVLLAAIVMLLVLECAVRLIQGYVFAVLSTLYLNDVNSPSLVYL